MIGKSNGVGLTRDLGLLEAALTASGCQVTVHPCERDDRRRRRSLLARLSMRARRRRGGGTRVAPFDVNVMLEHVWPQFVHQAPRNVLVPNPEWTDRRDLAMLGVIDRAWTKTRVAREVFAARGVRCWPIGFDSEDRLQGAVPRLPFFLHLAGRSPLKGTEHLLALWRRHPEWPRLTVVQCRPDGPDGVGAHGGEAGNIVHERAYLGDQEIRTLQNAHRFHLCVSEAEGWGHYIAEAMSVGAVTLTTDAPPMNELVEPERGLLVAARLGETHNLARVARFDEAALSAAVMRVQDLSTAQLDSIGEAARRWFIANKQGFTARVLAALNELTGDVPEQRSVARR
ncbi:MAG: glycosyltransferase [Steroidobacteraceae bacterium]